VKQKEQFTAETEQLNNMEQQLEESSQSLQIARERRLVEVLINTTIPIYRLLRLRVSKTNLDF
jgi:hypothetical protein